MISFIIRVITRGVTSWDSSTSSTEFLLLLRGVLLFPLIPSQPLESASRVLPSTVPGSLRSHREQIQTWMLCTLDSIGVGCVDKDQDVSASHGKFFILGFRLLLDLWVFTVGLSCFSFIRVNRHVTHCKRDSKASCGFGLLFRLWGLL